MDTVTLYSFTMKDMKKLYTQEERFGIHYKTGVDVYKTQSKPKCGRLWLDGRVICEGLFYIIGKKKRDLVEQGINKERIKITY